MRLALIVLTILGLGVSAHAAEEKGNPAAGKKTAAILCVQCHDITGDVKERNPPGNAPAFIALANAKDKTPESIRRYLTFPHGRMDNVLVGGRDVDNVVSYIVSLRSN